MFSNKSNTIIPLNYLIQYCSSSEPNFPVHNIMKHQTFTIKGYPTEYFSNPGWSSIRFCSYPQIIIIQFLNLVEVKEINILINHERIPQKIDIYSFTPNKFMDLTMTNDQIINCDFRYIGYINFTNHKTNNRELKKIFFPLKNYISIKNCFYLKFVIHNNFVDSIRNKFDQVGIIDLQIFGYESTASLPILKLDPYESIKTEKNDLTDFRYFYKDEDYIDFIKNKINFAKNLYYNGNERQKNNSEIYNDILQLREFGRKIIGLEEEQKKYHYLYDYANVNKIEDTIEEVRLFVEDKYRMYSDNYVPFEDDIKSKLEISNNFNEHLSSNSNENENKENDINNILIKNDNNINAYYNYSYDNNEKSLEILRKFKEKKMMIEENKNRAEENIKLENLNNINL